MNSNHTIYLAGGCFWGVQEYFSRIPGVIETEVGYAQGFTDDPTYEDVCYKDTGYAETVKVVFDDAVIPLEKILYAYFKIIDPTLIDRQGMDMGHQYRTGIYYTAEDDRGPIEAYMAEEQKKYPEKQIWTELEKIETFYTAEDYHQDYLKKNPRGYCHVDMHKADEFE